MQPRILGTMSVLAIVISAGACGKDEDPAEFAKKQADKRQAEKFKGGAKKIPVPVTGGVKIACADLIQVDVFSKHLNQEVTLEDFTRRSTQKNLSAECKLRHAGEKPSKAEQEKLLAETEGRLGVLGGDAFCEIRVYCSLPDQDIEKTCRDKRGTTHKDLGVLACVTTSQRGPDDAYRYSLVEPDTNCLLDILGGPSVVGDPTVRACAAAAIESMTSSSLDGYK